LTIIDQGLNILEVLKDLDKGEQQAIQLAYNLQLPLLIEEEKGRKIAKQLGLKFSGIAGQIIKANRENLISAHDGRKKLGELNTMTTLLESLQVPTNKLVLDGISWEKFEQITTTFQDIEGVRFIYLDGELEIVMSPSQAHEDAKSTIGVLLEAYMKVKKIRFYRRGSATLGKKEITGRKEPDESYNIHSKKEIPDLVIEVIITSGDINILEIYRRIGIPEVWFYQNNLLIVYILKNEQYIKANHSQLLPELNLETFTKYINYPDQYDAVTEFINNLS
jgi:Uma2 family endonuclease